jgi:hypothetical protein
MRQPAASPLDRSRWGGLPELIVFAQMENVAVFIHSDTSNVYVISPQGISSVEAVKELHLQWRGGMHYNFLEPSNVNIA